MKPLKLTVCAFGPYRSKLEIDFTKLNENGLYLITGKTGAGKSTIFEALSYGLYGETVSGNDNRSAALLRNEMADDSLETYVEVDFECNGKHYHIRRSPKYSLTQLKRGKTEAQSPEDYKVHNPTVTLECKEDGTVYCNDTDVTSKIISIIGIDKKNFRRICVIAQGEFMSAVKEDTKQRREILNAVFDTGNYVLLTDRLKKLCENAKDSKNSFANEMNAAKNIITCKEDDPIRKTLELQAGVKSATPEYYEGLTDQVNELIKSDEEISKELQSKTEAYDEQERKLTEKLNSVKQLSEKQAKLSQLKEQSAVLESQLPVLKQRAELCKDNPAKVEEIRGNAAVLRSVIPEYKRTEENKRKYAEVLRNISADESKAEKLKKDIPAAEEAIKTIKFRIGELDGVDVKLVEKSSEYERVVEYGKKLRQISEEFKSWLTIQSDAESKRKKYEEADKNVESKTKKYIEVKGRYDSDLACYLASELKEGCSCPVCGSLSHPSPAAAKGDAPTKTDLDNAEKDMKKSEKQSQEYQIAYKTKVVEADSKIGNVRQNAQEIINDDISNDRVGKAINEELTAKREQAVKLGDEIKLLQKQSAEKKTLEKTLESKTAELEKIKTELSAVENRLCIERENAKHLSEDIEQSKQKLKHSSEAEAMQEINSLEAQANKLRREYDDCQKALADHNNKMAEYKGSMTQISQEIESIPVYDKEALLTEKAKLETEKSASRKIYEEVTKRLARNCEARNIMSGKIEEFRKACEYYNNCEDLYNTSAGMFTGKKISIQAYVLMSYLDSILEMANVRLQRMFNGRYKLYRSGKLKKGNAQGGLDIDIFDCSTGKYRSVSTVSGGEAFIIALCMAMGMSDMIQQQAGGINIESMFIDEGFGSLSSDVLDNAVQALQTISSGNCTIGIISHVERLKSMITKRIEVETDDNNITTATVRI